MSGPSFSVIVKGPSHFGVIFLLLYLSLRFFASSQTLSLTLNPLKVRLSLSSICCLANLWAARASSLADFRSLSHS